jgi:hypothetical protein
MGDTVQNRWYAFTRLVLAVPTGSEYFVWEIPLVVSNYISYHTHASPMENLSQVIQCGSSRLQDTSDLSHRTNQILLRISKDSTEKTFSVLLIQFDFWLPTHDQIEFCGYRDNIEHLAENCSDFEISPNTTPAQGLLEQIMLCDPHC